MDIITSGVHDITIVKTFIIYVTITTIMVIVDTTMILLDVVSKI